MTDEPKTSAPAAPAWREYVKGAITALVASLVPTGILAYWQAQLATRQALATQRIEAVRTYTVACQTLAAVEFRRFMAEANLGSKDPQGQEWLLARPTIEQYDRAKTDLIAAWGGRRRGPARAS
jgi:hypothetical protein